MKLRFSQKAASSRKLTPFHFNRRFVSALTASLKNCSCIDNFPGEIWICYCLGAIAVYSARLWQSSEVFWVCRVPQTQSVCMACPLPNNTMLLSPLGFLDIICLLSDFWLHHLGLEATPERIWCLSALLCRKTCSCSWTSNCIIKPWLADFILAGCFVYLSAGRFLLGMSSASGQAPSAADGYLANSQTWWFSLSLKRCKVVTTVYSDWKVTELVSSREGWSCKSAVFFVWGLRGIWVSSEALRSPGMECNTITLWVFFF